MTKCINIAYCVPDDKADEVHAIFKQHSAWMESFYAVSLVLQEVSEACFCSATGHRPSQNIFVTLW